MSHTYAQNILHVVFSTKERRKAIPPEFQPRLWAYIVGICKKEGVFVQSIGGMARSPASPRSDSAVSGDSKGGRHHQSKFVALGTRRGLQIYVATGLRGI